MDERLEELFDELEPRTDIDNINPWRRPTLLTVWGIALTTVTVNMFYLNTILPALGVILMYLGLRPLRRENGGFRTAWAIACAKLTLTAVNLAVWASPFGWGAAGTALGILMMLAQMVQLAALRAGLGEIFDRAGEKRRLGPVNWLIGFNAALVLGAVLRVGDLGLIGLAVLACYAGVLISLGRLPAAVGDTGYALRNCPVRLGDAAATAALAAVMLAAALCGRVGGTALRVPEAVPFEPSGITGGETGEVLELLGPEDARLLDGAENIQIAWREPETLPDGVSLRLATVTAELPRDRIVIIHYFEYQDGSPRWGDGLSCWQSFHLTPIDNPGGGVIFERGGKTWRSGLVNAGREVSTGFFSGDTRYTKADIFTPSGAENVRGYIIETVRAPGLSRTQINYNCEVTVLHNTFLSGLGKERPGDTPAEGDHGRGREVEHLTLFRTRSRDGEKQGEDHKFTIID